jgi:hypothetical protein
VRVTPEFYGYLERNFIPQNSERYREINLEFMGLILNKSGDRQKGKLPIRILDSGLMDLVRCPPMQTSFLV